MDLPFQKMVDPYWLLLEMVYPTHIPNTTCEIVLLSLVGYQEACTTETISIEG